MTQVNRKPKPPRCPFCGAVARFSTVGGKPTCGRCMHSIFEGMKSRMGSSRLVTTDMASTEPYVCPCGAGFPTKDYLAAHMMARHSPYQQPLEYMKHKARLRPDGSKAATLDEYVAAWDALKRPIEAALGLRTVYYDPALLLQDPETGRTLELSVEMAMKLVAALTPRQPACDT